MAQNLGLNWGPTKTPRTVSAVLVDPKSCPRYGRRFRAHPTALAGTSDQPPQSSNLVMKKLNTISIDVDFLCCYYCVIECARAEANHYPE